jgi:hypothetical protein
MITSYLKNLRSLFFHKNLKDLFNLFLGMTFENNLLQGHMLHKSMFNPPFSAPFFDTFYRSHIDSNYLLGTIFLYLESSFSFEMRVYKFIKLNPFGSIMDLILGDLHYAKLNVCCSTKCDETFCNKSN